MIEFIDLKAQQARLKDKIEAGIQNVLTHGQYILGPEVKELEDHKCYACGQDFHDDKHLEVTLEKTTLLENARAELADLENKLSSNQSLVTSLGSKPIPKYKTEAEAIRHSGDVANLKKVYEDMSGKAKFICNKKAISYCPLCHLVENTMAHEWCTEAVSEAVSNVKQGITYHLIIISNLIFIINRFS